MLEEYTGRTMRKDVGDRRLVAYLWWDTIGASATVSLLNGGAYIYGA
jgi:hypothetical protein